jgi:hypothetical protein
MPNDAFGIIRAWEFFEVGNDLLVSVIPRYDLEGVIDSAGNLTGHRYVQLSSPVYRLAAGEEIGFEEVPVDFFNGLANPELDWISGRVARPLRFREHTVYIGAKTVTDHNWTPFGLFSADSTYSIHTYSLAEGMQPWDLLVERNTLYVLVSVPHTAGETTVGVLATCDLSSWREVLHFSAPTFARSFALYNGDFYFGAGTEASSIAPDAGNILKVSGVDFDRNCS